MKFCKLRVASPCATAATSSGMLRRMPTLQSNNAAEGCAPVYHNKVSPAKQVAEGKQGHEPVWWPSNKENASNDSSARLNSQMAVNKRDSELDEAAKEMPANGLCGQNLHAQNWQQAMHWCQADLRVECMHSTCFQQHTSIARPQPLNSSCTCLGLISLHKAHNSQQP